MTDQQLMNFLDFDESELQANRNNRLSEKQKTRLIKEECGQKGCSTILGVFLLIIAFIGVAIAYVAVTEAGRENLTEGLIFGAGFGCLWPLVWGSIGIASLFRTFAKMEVQVKKAEGPINIVKAIRQSYNSTTHTHSDYSVYELHIGGHAFDVKAGLPGFMMQGDVYAVYYAQFNLKDKKREIISAELLTKAGADVFMSEPVLTDDPEVVEYLRKGDLLRAIKAHRLLHNSSLEEAKSIVREIQVRLGY